MKSLSKSLYNIATTVQCSYIILGKVAGEETGRKGAAVINALLSVVPEPEKHTLTMDNFFGDYRLLSELADKGVAATSTVRENRVHGAPLQKKKAQKKKPRGSVEYCSDGVVTTCCWVDNKPVFAISNHLGVHPTEPKQRFSQKEKRYVQIECPSMLVQYNKTMGGVNQVDRTLSEYRPHIRGVKWYYPFFTHGLNIMVAAAWRLSHIIRGKRDHLEFRRQVVTCLLKIEDSHSAKLETTRQVLGDVRFDGVGHVSVKADKEGRCHECKRNTFYSCGKCKVKLHLKCHIDFHTLV